MFKDTEKYIIKKGYNTYYFYEVYDLSKVLEQYSISKIMPFYYNFVFNKFNYIVSEFKKRYFVLLKINSNFDRHVSYDSFLYIYAGSCKLMWYYQLIKRSDFIEENYLRIRGKYSVIDDSIDYYLGLLEMAIYYLRDFSNYIDNGYIQHEKITDSLFYNPLNIKIDLKERDFAEYLKYLFWTKKYRDINVNKLIEKNKDVYNYSLIMARLLYPNYYFDALDEVVFFNKDVTLVKEIVARHLEFKNYYFYLLSEVSKYYNIKKISF